MKGKVIPFTIMGMLFALALMGGSVMVWQAGVASPELAPAQEQLIALADWTVKAAVGALLGFAGGVGLARRKGR